MEDERKLKALADHERTAVEKYIRKASLPIVQDGPNQLEPWGTSTLFEEKGRLFLVTAKHVLTDATDKTKLAYPLADSAGNVETFGSFDEIHHPFCTTVDVVVLELRDETVIKNLKASWTVLDIGMIALPGTYQDGERIVGGYPVEIHKLIGTNVHQPLLILRSEPLRKIPAEVETPVPDYDQFFLHANDGERLDGTTAPTPKLNGVSGGSVWIYIGDNSEVWSPSKSLKIIGVQVSSKHGEWFRAANWKAVMEIFESLAKNE